MAATPSVVVKKTLAMEGRVQDWSNRYHFTGGTPADNTHWNTLFDAIVAAEKAIYLASQVTITELVGYTAGSTVSAHAKSYTQAGTFTSTGYQLVPGDCCAVCRFSTAARSTKGHPIYLFKYWHGVLVTSNGESLHAAYQTAVEAYADAWWNTGFSDGANTYTLAGPQGAAATARSVHTYAGHRDFPS